MFNKIYYVAIVGAGACGLFCTFHLEKTLNVIIFDKNIGGKKLSIAGNNRCSIANLSMFDDFLEGYSKNGQFLRDIFKEFFRERLSEWLGKNNFPYKIENNKIFLKHKMAYDLANFLGRNAKKFEYRDFELVENIQK